ncbi:hypothetical protein GCM10018781_40120 [Kitasatospora indigofera]|uniref:Uncharacterized protein n=1 Tax=Kitasatospora indigofera TaxID=67307 RepID=A0A919FX40_9ACTN|nr:hypothetical protein GCM10018781_40120 [Kitasatospora indigofera]
MSFASPRRAAGAGGPADAEPEDGRAEPAGTAADADADATAEAAAGVGGTATGMGSPPGAMGVWLPPGPGGPGDDATMADIFVVSQFFDSINL